MPPAKETIVVIDDEPEVRSLIEDMLRGLGYTVLATGDPQAALQFARTHPDPIHLLLTDVVMPLMAGSTLCEEFRILRPGARVLFMSGYETVEAYGVRLAPGEPVLHKPFKRSHLEQTVRAAFLRKLGLASSEIETARRVLSEQAHHELPDVKLSPAILRQLGEPGIPR